MAYKNYSLTKTEKEVLHLICDEFLTIKQIQIRRGCSFQAVYKIIKKLKEKGAIDHSLNKVEEIRCPNPNDVRLHGQEFNIKILFQEKRYQKELKKSNVFFLGGNTIKLFRNSIEIYSGNSFIGKTAKEADSKALDFWEHFFNRLEHELGISIWKERSRNIREVNHHYARGDSEIAENSIKNKKRIRVFSKEDGKLAFITDNSFGFKEDETVHPITAKQDREAIDKQINDWRLNNPPTISEIALIQSETAQNLNILVNTMSEYGKHIKSHTESIKALSKAIPKLVETLNKLQKENNDLKQRKLSEW